MSDLTQTNIRRQKLPNQIAITALSLGGKSLVCKLLMEHFGKFGCRFISSGELMRNQSSLEVTEFTSRLASDPRQKHDEFVDTYVRKAAETDNLLVEGRRAFVNAPFATQFYFDCGIGMRSVRYQKRQMGKGVDLPFPAARDITRLRDGNDCSRLGLDFMGGRHSLSQFDWIINTNLTTPKEAALLVMECHMATLQMLGLKSIFYS